MDPGANKVQGEQEDLSVSNITAITELNDTVEPKKIILEEAEESVKDLDMEETLPADNQQQQQQDAETWGTPQQKFVVKDYPMMGNEQKLKVPYIERFNGNICVAKQEYEQGIAHYNKALLSLKMLFQIEDDPCIKTEGQAIKMIMDIEVIVCTNLAHCYIKMEQYHHAIKYASQALEKDRDNRKALYRMGIAYTNVGELDKAKEALDKVLSIEGDEGMKNSARLGL